jgi:ring-1,2-phenylacetyl-CoA epoxidase subunit PaaC
MSAERPPLADWLLARADDEMLLAHRNSEWTGHAPILEEDIAFANLALDEMGHAALWYQTLAELLQEAPGEYADRMVFFRPAHHFRNLQMVELPNGDWAFSMLRQYLFDCAEAVWLPQLATSSYEPLANAAQKIRIEELYHLRHTRAWVRRLGLGTEESNRRMQAALDKLWPYALQLWVPLPDEERLLEQGFIPDSLRLGLEWEASVRAELEACGLQIPEGVEPITHDRGEHSRYLQPLVEEMQQVARQEPEARW